MTETGSHRHPSTIRITAGIALVAALGAVGLLLTLHPGAPSAPTGEPALADVIPGGVPTDLSGTLPDGAPYTPVFFLDTRRSVGTAPTPDESAIRLLLIDGGQQRVLQTVPREQAPEFAGFTADGTTLAWLELTVGKDGGGATRVLAAPLAAGPARQVTAETGAVVLFDKQGDLSLHDGQLSWMADLGKPGTTTLFTVPLAGGKPQRRELDGAWSVGAWPWLVSDPSADGDPVRLRELTTGHETTIKAQPGEMVNCSPTWCRSVVIGSSDGTTVIELSHPDGSGRIRTAAGNVAPTSADVAMLDRYEIYSRADGGFAAAELLLYDIAGARLLRVAAAAGQVVARDGVLWWSTGDNEALTWHVLDLRAL